MREILKSEEFLRNLEKLYFVVKKINFGTRTGDSLSKRIGSSLEFVDYKNYQPGDDLRSVDWNLYGRLDKLYLKLFQEEVDLNIYIFLDTSLSMTGGATTKGAATKLFYIKQLAAAVSYIGLKSLNSVGIIRFSDDIDDILLPSRKRSHIHPIFDFLENTSPGKETNINKTMKTFALRKGIPVGIALVLSDFFSPSGYKEGIKYLIHKGFLVNIIQVLSLEELNPNVTGKVQIQDVENYSSVDLEVNEIVLKKYREKLDKYIDDLKKFCTMYNVTNMHTTTDVHFEETILKFFMMQNRAH